MRVESIGLGVKGGLLKGAAGAMSNGSKTLPGTKGTGKVSGVSR